MSSFANNPLVSVLMPAYNSEAYISAAIESVLESTYQNFELIITDDRSKDNTLNIAKAYENKDARVKVILNDKNYGDYPNRNQAASYAKGKYLKYVDHDDYIYPYGLEQLVFYMEQFPMAGYGLCSLYQHRDKVYPFQLNSEEAYRMNYFEMELFNKAPLSSIIRKTAFEAVGGFTGKPFLGDFELWHLLSQEYPVVLMPSGIVWYRVHVNQESSKIHKDPVNSFKYLTLGKDFVSSENCPLNKADQKKAIKHYQVRQGKAVFSALKHFGWDKAMELKKLSRMSYAEILRNKFEK